MLDVFGSLTSEASVPFKLSAALSVLSSSHVSLGFLQCTQRAGPIGSSLHVFQPKPPRVPALLRTVLSAKHLLYLSNQRSAWGSLPPLTVALPTSGVGFIIA